MGRRIVGLVAVLAAVLLNAGVAQATDRDFGPLAFSSKPTAAHGQVRIYASTARAGNLKVRESGIQFTRSTVVVSRATVQANLIGISLAGVFEFKHAAGPLAQVRPGKVMFLQGADALMVTKVSHKGGKLLVSTKPATLTQFISKGRVQASGTPNFHDAIIAPLVQPPSSAGAAGDSRAANDFLKPTYPYVGRPSTGLREATIAGIGSDFGKSLTNQITLNGSIPLGPAGIGAGYSITLSPGTGSKLNVSGNLCFGAGGICSNGPANGADLQIYFSGSVDVGNLAADINVNNSRVSSSNLDITNPESKLKFTYTAQDSEIKDLKPPTFYFPVGTDLTLPGEIPIYAKIQFGVYIKTVFSSKNSTVHGGLIVDDDGGLSTVDESGKSVSGHDSGFKDSGTVLDQTDGGVPPSITPGPAGLVTAFQFPKIGLGLGWTAANGVAYVQFIDSFGQTTGAAVAGMICSIYDVAISFQGGIEAQIGIPLLGASYSPSPINLVPQKHFTTHDPGCPSS